MGYTSTLLVHRPVKYSRLYNSVVGKREIFEQVCQEFYHFGSLNCLTPTHCACITVVNAGGWCSHVGSILPSSPEKPSKAMYCQTVYVKVADRIEGEKGHSQPEVVAVEKALCLE